MCKNCKSCWYLCHKIVKMQTGESRRCRIIVGLATDLAACILKQESVGIFDVSHCSPDTYGASRVHIRSGLLGPSRMVFMTVNP